MRALHAITAIALLWTSDVRAADSPPAAGDPTIPHEKYVLDNGLEVILVPDRTVPLVAVTVWYHVGSGHEVPGKSGFAHLFEHMLFQGSVHTGEDVFFDILQQAGAVDRNGTTNTDRTNYFEVVPSHQLETVLWLESDRMGYFLPTVTQPSLTNQIAVVKNERRQRYENVAYGETRFALAQMMYPEGHPYRYLTIGRVADLDAASLDDVTAFYRTWYTPANATLAIGGDFDVAEAKALVTKWFGSFPKSRKPAVVAIPAPTVEAQRAERVDDFARLPQLTMQWHSPAAFGEGEAALALGASILGNGSASRLYKLLVVETRLAQSVSASQGSRTFSGLFTVTVTLQSDADVAEVERLVDAEIARLRDELVSPRERDRAVTRTEAGAVWQLESLLARVETLQRYNHYLGDPDRLAWDLARYRAVTAEDIRAEVQRHLLPERKVAILTRPSGANKKEGEP